MAKKYDGVKKIVVHFFLKSVNSKVRYKSIKLNLFFSFIRKLNIFMLQYKISVEKNKNTLFFREWEIVSVYIFLELKKTYELISLYKISN